MAYSCAYFRHEHDTLEQAQQQKYEHICRKLQLKAGETLVDIGCGWGGMLIYAAKHYGVHGVSLVVAIVAVTAYWWLAAKPVDEEPVVGWQQQATGQLWARDQADAHGYSHFGKLSIAILANRL
jgi:hypothetical protein